MKTALLPVAAFTVALIATTTWSVMKTPLPELPVNHAALADSLLADSLWRDSVATHEATTAADAGHAQPETPAHRQPVTTVARAPSSPEPASADPESQRSTMEALARRSDAYQSLARIFARMKPAEAADVLEHMSNREIEGVVRNLGARQAASILANLPEERAAALARLLLIPLPDGTQ